jgi:hypothetical protein
MFNFLGFGQRKKAKAAEKQREMIRVALNTVLRRRNIPPRAMGCEVMPMSRIGAADVTLVQLVLLSWNEGLMQETNDLENELFEVICMFTRNTRRADFLFLWKLALEKGQADNKGPRANLADAGSEPASAPQNLSGAPKLVPVPKIERSVKFDLPRTALDEDDDDHRDSRFPPTVVGSQ